MHSHPNHALKLVLTLCTPATLPDEFELEVRNLENKTWYNRNEILGLVHCMYDKLLLSSEKSKNHAFVADGVRVRGGKGGRGGVVVGCLER